MPRFFRIYDYKAAGAFRGTPLKLANGWLVAGSLDGNALVALIGFDGNPVWQKKYSLAGKKITFNGLLRTGAKIFAYGVIHISDRRADNLLLQIDQNGNLVNWANLPATKPAMAIHSDFSRYNIKLNELSNGRLLFTGWHNQFGSTDHAELFVVNLLEGQLVQAAKCYVNHDTQVYHTTTVPNDPKRLYAYISGSAQVGSVKGLFAVVGYKNRLADSKTAHLLTAKDAQMTQLFASHPLAGKSHIVAGTFSKVNQTGGDTLFIAQITTDDDNANPTIAVNKTLAFRFGGENKRVMNIVKFGNNWLLTGFLATSVTPFVLCLDQNLNIIWAKSIQTGQKAVLADAEVFDAANFVITGYQTGANNLTAPAMFYTDGQLASCKTEPLALEQVTDLVLQTETIKSTFTFDLYANDSGFAKTYFPDIVVSPLNTTPMAQCPEKEFVFSNGERMPQSPFLHLQAAGSLGVESTAGIHLRWAFLRSLGDNHLAKGDFPAAQFHFNKPNDFVHLYRIPYANNVAVNFPLATQNPLFKDDTQARWRYNVPGIGNVDVWFADKAKYDACKNQPTLAGFWAAYKDKDSVVEIELKNTLAFSVVFNMAATGNFELKVETLGAESNHPLTPKTITARQVYTQATIGPRRILSENLRSVRCSWNNGNLSVLSFELYDTCLATAVQNGAIEYIGAFALTQNDQVAYTRLEEKPRTVVHGLWKKFNEDAFVNVANYQKRWNKTGGLKQGIGQYLALSNQLGNPTATTQVSDDPDIAPGGKTITVSYLDMLQIAATDYHVARMLGLGHLDTPKGHLETAYVYLMEYHTVADLQDGGGTRTVQHLYMSLPTARKDQRFPEEIKVEKITYGLNDQSQIALTDDNGYTPDGMNRYINVFTALKNNPDQGNTLFQAADRTNPIFAGIEYRKLSAPNWQKPEIAHYSETVNPNDPLSPKLYQDTKGIAETAMVLFYEDSSKPSLVHRETDPGIHEYAAYPINIFSRSGEPALLPESTNDTKFTRRNTLLPPSDVRVQLIQPEDTLVLTSKDEQDMLKALSQNKDNTLVRLTFNYSHIQDANYDFGDYFEIFFRQEMPHQVMGQAKNIVSNAKQSDVDGGDYTFHSNGQVSKPIINNPGAYVGGSFVHDGKRFEIKGVSNLGGGYPKFTLQNLEERTVITNGSQQTITLSSIGPKADDKPFMAIENMANAANWGINNPLNYKIDIDTSQWTVRQEKEGENIVQIRGIWGTAKLEKLMTEYVWVDEEKYPYFPWKEEENPALKTEKIHTGYKLTFDKFQLNRHKQHKALNQRTEWYGGVVRVPFVENGIGSKTEKWRTLPVIKIIQEYDSAQQPTGQLVLYVGDDTLEPSDLVLNTSKEVNFYPGYRCYLLADPGKGFHAPNIMPAPKAGHKNTLLAMRTVDKENMYTSLVGVPAILMAQEIVAPVAAQMPIGPEYATPPDVYNKSTYTFTAKFNTEPFAVALYRADTNAILNALYKPETVNAIKIELDKRPVDKNWAARWRNLVHPTEQFMPFDGYQFPNPEKLGSTFDKKIILAAIRTLFVPITKEPLLPKDYTSGPITQARPALWDGAKKQLTFTDFTLDGGMNTAYFYFVRNISMQMSMDEPSPILGPVQLVNTRPPAPITLTKVLTRLPGKTAEETAAVHFECLAPVSSEKISKIRIYRSFNSADALHLRSMKPLAKDIDLGTLQSVDGVFLMEDNFLGEEIPYGDPLYYRIVGLRQVQYKDLSGNLVIEEIPSLPSKLILANVMDSINPEPPVATYSSAGNNGNTLSDVKIHWNKTTYKGRYSLFKLDIDASGGQWIKVKAIENTTNDPVITVRLSDTDLNSGNLAIKDSNGKSISHHFKVSVESTSGLLNEYDKVLTVGD